MSNWTAEQVRASAQLAPNVLCDKLNRLEAEKREQRDELVLLRERFGVLEAKNEKLTEELETLRWLNAPEKEEP